MTRISLVAIGLALTQPTAAPAQTAPAAAPPSPTLPAAAPSTSELGELVRRLRDLEETNKKLLKEAEESKRLREDFQDLSKKYEDLSRKVDGLPASDGPSAPAPAPAPAGGTSTSTAAKGNGNGNDVNAFVGGGGVRNRAEAQQIGNRRLGLIKLKTGYNYEAGGFQFSTEDDELQLKVRGLIQADAKVFSQAGPAPLNNSFIVPRARLYFDGRISKPIQYQVSIQDSYGVLNLFNAYLNFGYDERLQLRVGRFKTPFTYEFYKLNVYNQLAPERSIYNVNFQANRQVGLMGWGELFEKRAEYAVGIFDGPRHSYQDFNAAKDVMAFVNFKPFEKREGSFLRDLNIGGSVDYGDQNNPLNPAVLRTNQQPSTSPANAVDGTGTTSLPFLAFNSNVRERGIRSLWELHLAYYYKGLTVLGAWDAGFDSYAINGAGHDPIKVPVGGYFIQAGYLLTGETIRERAMIDPLRPFDLRKGKFGLGAFEPTIRFSTVNLGNEVFTGGLADPNLWTNHVNLVDVGLNWYLNKAVRVFIDWEHAEFGQPVVYRPGPALQKNSDLFWARLQLYF
jgi:phosphate-selective porin OprO/OprP